MNKYNCKRHGFIRYCRFSASHLGTLYFSRGKTDVYSLPLQNRSKISRIYDFEVDKILANDMLFAYIMDE